MPMIMRCRECGWIGNEKELLHRDVREDWGDVCCRVCPGCHRTDYEGRQLFEKMEEEPCR